MTGPAMDLAAARDCARMLAVRAQRTLLGITGPPGAGKSTLAEIVVREIGARAVLVPMDGFHLADAALRRLDRLERKGAPDTFDVDGFVALLERLRRHTGRPVYAPAFDRELEQPVAGSIEVDDTAALVVIEGNYLLLEDERWAAVRPLLDEIWWIDSDPDVRRVRLVDRHIRFGKQPAAARAWVREVDDANARRLGTGRARADRVIAALPDLPAGR